MFTASVLDNAALFTPSVFYGDPSFVDCKTCALKFTDAGGQFKDAKLGQRMKSRYRFAFGQVVT